MSLLVRDAGGRMIVIGNDGSRTPATQEQVGGLRPIDPINEGGLTVPERFTFMNLTNNPSTAKEYLRTIGYYVAPYGKENDYNFAIQKAQFDEAGNPLPPDPDNWRVTDPNGGKDFLNDIMDVTADLLGGAVTTAGAAAGSFASPVLGTAAGAGIAGGGFELARQALGQAAGVPQDIDPTQAGLVGAFSAATPFLGSAVGAAAKKGIAFMRGTGNVALEFGAKLTGTPAAEAFSAGEKVLERASLSKPLDVLGTLGILRESIRRNAIVGFQETAQVKAIVDAHPTIRINVTAELQALKAMSPRNNISALYPGLEAETTRLIDQALSHLGSITTGKVQLTRVLATPAQADEFKTVLQNIANLKDAYALANRGVKIKGSTAEFYKRAKATAGTVNAKLRSVLPASYGSLNDILSQKRKAQDVVMKGLLAENAERFARSLFSANRAEKLAAVGEYDRLFGTDFVAIIRKLGASLDVGTGLIPRLTATGGIQGPSAISAALVPLTAGAGAGFVAGGGDPGTTAAGAAIGLGLAAPRGFLGAVRAVTGRGGTTIGGPSRFLQRQASNLQRIASARGVPEALRGVAIIALQSLAKEVVPQDRPTLRQDAKRRELEQGRRPLL